MEKCSGISLIMCREEASTLLVMPSQRLEYVEETGTRDCNVLTAVGTSDKEQEVSCRILERTTS